MDHGPAVDNEPDPASVYKTRIGVYLVLFYGLVFTGFIVLNTFIPQIMTTKTIFQLNLAVFYGFGLIFLAIIMGLIYNFMCSKKEDELKNTEGVDL